MKLTRSNQQKTRKGPSENFSGGDVYISGSFAGDGPSRVTGATVTFTPGARSNWHTHPIGQTLLVTEGVGRTQCEGEDIVEIRAGDIIWCPPDHKHWHGASSTQAMTHIAIQEQQDGVAVKWLEPVTDEEYAKGPAS